MNYFKYDRVIYWNQIDLEAGGVIPPVNPTNGILTESGDFLLTESGDFLIQES